MNANNAVSNSNRNYAGSDQEEYKLKITLLIRVWERQINKRQCVYFHINGLRYVVTLMRYFLLCLALNTGMKKISNISNSISVNNIIEAAESSFVGHTKKLEVIEFKKDIKKNCEELYERLMNDSWYELLSYRKLVKTNRNNKIRHIDSPSLITRIYQHLLLNLINPIYRSKDNYNGLNCKKGCGITANDKRRSIVHKLKHIYYDRLDLKYCLVIDQRKCYDHITEKVFRKMLKKFIDDKWLIDFAVRVCFIDGKLPIGTPTSPFVHHVVMLTFDYFSKEISAFSLRYADDNFLAFYTLEDAQSAKWRIKNFWWYELGIRSKRNLCIIRPLDSKCDFCGYVFFRNNNSGKCSHNKGYVRVRESLAKSARLCNNNNSWNSYFGLLSKADAFSLMEKIETKMKLRNLTDNIRVTRSMDARNIDIKDLLGRVITIYDYEIKYSGNQPNWIKCLIGIDEVINNVPTGKILAFEFHGNYQNIIQFILMCESSYGKQNILSIEDVEIENQCGYIFKGSTNQLIYIK